MPQACPFCRASVNPTKNAAGQLVCPRCNNTGKPVVPASVPAWSPPPAAPAPGSPVTTWTAAPPAAQLQTPSKATTALILGIVSFVVPFVGPITASLAWIFGNQAMRMIEAQPHTYTGHGLARAGKILGIVWIALIVAGVVLAAIVFVLVSNLSSGNNTTADPVTMAILG